MEQVNGGGLLTALAVLVGVCGVLTALWKGLEALRGLSGTEKRNADRMEMARRLAALDARLSDCEERLGKGDRRFESTRNDLTQLLNALNALLMHFISGNDHDKLRSVKDGLDQYLAGR